MSNIIIRTEAWNTSKGIVIKAVARNEQGLILGATNQTAAIASANPVVVGKK